MARERVQDRRVRKTEGRLRDALVSLIHEKSYDSIVVKEILERADVGRTAFYSHFRDKDALLASGIQQLLEDHRKRSSRPMTDPFHDVLWFSLPFFEHVAQFRHRALHMHGKGRHVVHEHLRHVLMELIADDMRNVAGRSTASAAGAPADVLVEYVVTTFLLVLNWWNENGTAVSARQAHDIFRALVVPTLAAQGHEPIAPAS